MSSSPGTAREGRGARVACHAFAAPTPGNGGFADRIDAVLGTDHHHLRNMNDVVTHAWQVDELELIPELYAPRRTVLEPLIPVITSKVKPIDYRQARTGVTTFKGTLHRKRSFEADPLAPERLFQGGTGLLQNGTPAPSGAPEIPRLARGTACARSTRMVYAAVDFLDRRPRRRPDGEPKVRPCLSRSR